jgi:hypothetical protein
MCNKDKNNETDEKRVSDMNTITAEKLSLSNFIKQNKSKIYEQARKNTLLNKEGKAIISKNDDWFYEKEWDEFYKKDE